MHVFPVKLLHMVERISSTLQYTVETEKSYSCQSVCAGKVLTVVKILIIDAVNSILALRLLGLSHCLGC